MSNHVPSLKHKLDEALKEIQRLKGSPKVQEQLNMANNTVAELMEQNDKIKNDLAFSQELAHVRLHELSGKADSLKTVLAENHALKAELEHYMDVVKNQKSDIQKFIENDLNREQQPLVVNHYHNCTINK